MFLAFYLKNGIGYFIEFCAWCYLDYFIYRSAFNRVNRMHLGNDLSFFLLRAIGAISAAIGVMFVWAFLYGQLMTGLQTGIDTTAITLPFIVLFMGLIMLSAFIAFRTNRRHRVVGIWNAD